MQEIASRFLEDLAARGRPHERRLLGEWVVLPLLLDWCLPVSGLRILLLGSGEGFLAVELVRQGARQVLAVDREPSRLLRGPRAAGLQTLTADATDLEAVSGPFDLVLAPTLLGAMGLAAMQATLREAHRLLEPGGVLVLAVPHPALPFLRQQEPPFWFARGGTGYFSARNRLLEGAILRRDGGHAQLRCVHKSVADVLDCVGEAGFPTLPEVAEFGVTEQHLDLDPLFYLPLRDLPLHLALRTVRP